MIREANIDNIVEPIITQAIAAHEIAGEDVTFQVGSVMVPTQEGMELHNYLSLSVASPIMGGPNPTATAVLDLRSIRSAEEADAVVSNLLVRVREIRSQMLQDSLNVTHLNTIATQ